MNTVVTLLFVVGSAAIIFRVAPKLVRSWRAAKIHHKQILADRKYKEGDYPDGSAFQ